MPYKNPEKQRAYQRDYQRKRRSQVFEVSDKPYLANKLESFEDLRLILQKITCDILNAQLDMGVKGRVIAQLLTVGIRLFEKTDLEQRVERLEERAERDKYC